MGYTPQGFNVSTTTRPTRLVLTWVKLTLANHFLGSFLIFTTPGVVQVYIFCDHFKGNWATGVHSLENVGGLESPSV